VHERLIARGCCPDAAFGFIARCREFRSFPCRCRQRLSCGSATTFIASAPGIPSGASIATPTARHRAQLLQESPPPPSWRRHVRRHRAGCTAARLTRTHLHAGRRIVPDPAVRGAVDQSAQHLHGLSTCPPGDETAAAGPLRPGHGACRQLGGCLRGGQGPAAARAEKPLGRGSHAH
jgi:hypothetical protein